MKNATRSLAFVVLLAVAHLLFVGSDDACGADSLITNGGLLEWSDGLPDGWKVEIGARNGADSPKSEVEPRSDDLRRQRPTCRRGDQRLSRNSNWRRQRIDFKVPPKADKTEVIIFLSKTGTLTVKNLLLSETSGRDPRGK
jgi:hypothetical protein